MPRSRPPGPTPEVPQTAGPPARPGTDLRRIAEALERAFPPPTWSAALLAAGAMRMRWTGDRLVAAAHAAPIDPGLFRGVEAQMAALGANLAALAAGAPAHDMLLWGARGMGKSALVKSLAHAHGLPLVEAGSAALESLGALFALLAGAPRPTVVFVDDLAFEEGGRELRRLRSLLDGGVEARPAHVRLAVTSNHRHLIARSSTEPEGARHARDLAEDQLALVDRFGLVLGFHLPDQETYLDMCRAYLERDGLPLDEADALAFALARGTRSGRTAWHYRVERLARRAVAAAEPGMQEAAAASERGGGPGRPG